MAYETAPAMGGNPAAGEEASESIQVPVSALRGAVVGDNVSFVVKSIDGENATLTVAEAAEPAEGEMNPEPSTVSKAAALFGEGGGE